MKLPTFEDFIDDLGNPPRGPTLDEDMAWNNFGGLTTEEAFKRFVGNPEFYQEDFMFMGGSAFAFYFPVIDRYIREVESKNEFADETWIIAHCIITHIPDSSAKYSDKIFTPLSDDPASVTKTYERIIDLCRFVIEGVKNIDASNEMMRTWPSDKVEEAWTELLEKTLSAFDR